MRLNFKLILSVLLLAMPTHSFAQDHGPGPGDRGGPGRPGWGGPQMGHHWGNGWGISDFQQQYEGLYAQNQQLQAQVTSLTTSNVTLNAQLQACQNNDSVDDQKVIADNAALTNANNTIAQQAATIGQLTAQLAQYQAVQPAPPTGPGPIATAPQNSCTLSVTNATGVVLTGAGTSWVSLDPTQKAAKAAAIQNCQNKYTNDPACSDATSITFNCSVVQAPVTH